MCLRFHQSARIQTVVCLPLLDGVVEFGTTERVQEDLGFIQHVKTFFTDHRLPNPQPPKPALSEHSTSNPATSSDHPRFHSQPIPAMYAAVDPPANANQEEDEEEEDDDDDEEEHESDSEAETGRNSRQAAAQNPQAVAPAVAEPSELMQLEMSEDIRLGSPDDASNNLDSDFNLLAVSQGAGNPDDHQRRVDSFRAESNRRWPMMPEAPLSSSGLQQAPSGPLPPEELTQEDTHYSQTVSTILQKQPSPWADSSSTGYVAYSTQSAFAKWTTRLDHHLPMSVEGTSQWLLKYILFSVPFLHNKYRDENSPKSREASGDAASRFRKGTPQDELSANHVLAERRRREKLNERFIILRSLVPFVTKMDKASILGDTIEYVKQLRKKIQDLETRNKQMEVDQRSKSAELQRTSSSGSKDQRSGQTVLDRVRVGPGPGSEKRKLRIVEASGGVAKPKSVDSPPPGSAAAAAAVTTSVQVSIIESDALVELQCVHREGLLLDIMQMLRELLIEVTAVQSSLNNGVFVAQLRAKVKDNVNGKKGKHCGGEEGNSSNNTTPVMTDWYK
ncbi:hypothetical protein Patl1_03404 [Pistacia atlantica]|uniref:Uncharacterized protein n=1 Tax=Pistacia atlantica TaxID=434234 RepID=A0ACC1C950_9ROSI|nr:hypothetical protein Patl1_03404 [Pistacia atlantica]